MERVDHLRQLATEAAGEHYRSAEARRILDAEDWSEFWPVIDADGNLTGDIVGSEEGYANVDDEVMIALDDCTPEQRRQARSTGYVCVP